MVESRLKPVARRLRNTGTEAERRLWRHLRAQQMGVRFTRQLAVGPFIVDFACRHARLVIELDGGQHSASTTDKGRTEIIESHGYRVIRFWNNEVMDNLPGVLFTIASELELARNRPG